MLRADSPRRTVLLVVVTCLAVVLVVVAVLAFAPDARVAAVPQDQPGPVLLVPGYGGGTSALQVLAERLRQEGRSVRVVALPGDATGDLRAQADALGVAAEQALASSGAPSVDVVGYSAGGVVARWWIAEDGGAAFVRRAVTLGSPQHGTQVAELAGSVLGSGCPVACQQLRPGSDLLDTLNDGDETPDGPRWTSVWTNDDETVTPADSARLTGADNIVLQQVCPGVVVSHAQLPSDPRVGGLVVLALSTDDVPASSAPCTGLSTR